MIYVKNTGFILKELLKSFIQLINFKKIFHFKNFTKILEKFL